jgi:hypothetical protein
VEFVGQAGVLVRVGRGFVRRVDGVGDGSTVRRFGRRSSSSLDGLARSSDMHIYGSILDARLYPSLNTFDMRDNVILERSLEVDQELFPTSCVSAQYISTYILTTSKRVKPSPRVTHPGVLNPTAGYNLPLSCSPPNASPMYTEFLVKNALPVVKSIPQPIVSPVVLVGQPRLVPSPRDSKM